MPWRKASKAAIHARCSTEAYSSVAIARVDRGHFSPSRIGTPAGNPAGQVARRHGPGDPVSLGQFAAKLQQHQSVLDRFHTFGDHLAMEGRRQSQHSIQNVQVLRVFEHIAYETLVDFEHARGQALEISQRGVACAKVVEGKRYSNLMAGIQHLRGLSHVLQRTGLQHLQLQAEGLGVAGGPQAESAADPRIPHVAVAERRRSH